MAATILTVIFPLILLLGVVSVWIYNRLVRSRNRLREGWSGIEVQLKRRHDLVPQLVSIVKAYAGFEKETLESVMTLRSAAQQALPAGAKTTRVAENKLVRKMGSLFALVEGYPDLKSDEQFSKLADNLVEIEDDLQYARRYYNGCARDLNNLVETFPGNLMSKVFGFGLIDFFEVDNASERLAPRVEKALT